MINLVIFGPLGSGKGTQAQKIKEKYGFIHFSTGDLLRDEIKKQTPLGKNIEMVVNSGALVSDELIEEIVKEFIKNNKNARGIIFDGFPRTLHQAEMLDKELANNNMKIDLVIKLDIPEATIKNRLQYRALKEGRADDNDETINNRLQFYYNHTLPILNYYKKTNKNIVDIYGDRDVNEVFNDICKQIDRLL
ncbi:MAG TPA: adenylate kinase [Bacteroidales bacterium]|jgi:adenylate kinase|nr:MAG: Adenylate kinase [Bacteroidetes bacterium ADurb.Bin035]HOJ23924.1 adenylate kinase [Bacteroidales bacterium]HOV54597.1 adenylate kinase [Bacteroidales bacterium]HPB20556.1 adenylate kinase [Bacteroidales bacterium]HPL03502.1 adenylate kinase [Bacteroidales bacterium]